jgi:hypothetical protein
MNVNIVDKVNLCILQLKKSINNFEELFKTIQVSF